MQKYFVSVVLQGELNDINFLIENIYHDLSLIFYNTFLKNIVDYEDINLNELSEADCNVVNGKLITFIEIETEVTTNDVNKILKLLKADSVQVNRSLARYRSSSVEFFVAAKQLSFKVESYIKVE